MYLLSNVIVIHFMYILFAYMHDCRDKRTIYTNDVCPIMLYDAVFYDDAQTICTQTLLGATSPLIKDHDEWNTCQSR